MELCHHQSGSVASSKCKPNCIADLVRLYCRHVEAMLLNIFVSEFLFTEDVFLDLLF